MEYYAAIKNDELVSFVGTWMNLETIILSKLTQEQKIKHHVITHNWELNNENTWTQEGEQQTEACWQLGGLRGDRALGELPNIEDGVMDAANHLGTRIPM